MPVHPGELAALLDGSAGWVRKMSVGLCVYGVEARYEILAMQRVAGRLKEKSRQEKVHVVLFWVCSESVLLSTVESFGHLNRLPVPKTFYMRGRVLLALYGNWSDQLTPTSLL